MRLLKEGESCEEFESKGYAIVNNKFNVNCTDQSRLTPPSDCCMWRQGRTREEAHLGQCQGWNARLIHMVSVPLTMLL